MDKMAIITVKGKVSSYMDNLKDLGFVFCPPVYESKEHFYKVLGSFETYAEGIETAVNAFTRYIIEAVNHDSNIYIEVEYIPLRKSKFTAHRKHGRKRKGA